MNFIVDDQRTIIIIQVSRDCKHVASHQL